MRNPETHPDDALLQSYLDGAADPGQTVLVVDHLESCATCRAHIRSYRTIFSGLAEMDLPRQPDPELAEKVMRRISGREAEERVRRVGVILPAALAAAFAVCLVLVLLFSRHIFSLPSFHSPAADGLLTSRFPATLLLGVMLEVLRISTLVIMDMGELLRQLMGLASDLLTVLPGVFHLAVILLCLGTYGVLFFAVHRYGQRYLDETKAVLSRGKGQ